MKADGVTEEEFRKGAQPEGGGIRERLRHDESTRAKNLARYHVFYGDANLINTELDRYLAVKREDLQRVAQAISHQGGREHPALSRARGAGGRTSK